LLQDSIGKIENVKLHEVSVFHVTLRKLLIRVVLPVKDCLICLNNLVNYWWTFW